MFLNCNRGESIFFTVIVLEKSYTLVISLITTLFHLVFVLFFYEQPAAVVELQASS